MITDWVQEEMDLKGYLQLLKVPLHPKLRTGKVTCWFHYSKTADLYSGTIKFRDRPAGKNIFSLSTKRRLSDVAVEAIFEIANHYGKQR